MKDMKDTENKTDVDEKLDRTESADAPPETDNNKEAPKEPALPPHKEYAKRMTQFTSYYRQLLYCVCAACGIGIVLGVAYNVIVGSCIAVASAVIYMIFTYDEMFKKIGVGYQSVEGGIRVKACVARYGEVIWIPSDLIWFDVIAIGDRAFESEKNDQLKKVFLPKTLKKIGTDIFCGCENMSEIYFEGTKEMWENIEKDTDLSCYRIIFEAKYPTIPKKKSKNKSKQKSVRSKKV